jgi:ATP-binding cassette subfamily C protein/ATP-binding cassette subfamily C protein EexD
MKNAAPAPSILTIALQTCRRAFILVAVFSAVINLLFLTIPLYLMQVFDRVLTSRSFDTLLYLTLIALAGVAQLALMEFLRSNTLVRVNAYLDGVLSPEAFERSVASSFRGRSYGHESMQDLATIRGFLSGPGIATVFDTPWSPAYVLVIFLIHPTLG